MFPHPPTPPAHLRSDIRLGSRLLLRVGRVRLRAGGFTVVTLRLFGLRGRCVVCCQSCGLQCWVQVLNSFFLLPVSAVMFTALPDTDTGTQTHWQKRKISRLTPLLTHGLHSLISTLTFIDICTNLTSLFKYEILAPWREKCPVQSLLFWHGQAAVWCIWQMWASQFWDWAAVSDGSKYKVMEETFVTSKNVFLLVSADTIFWLESMDWNKHRVGSKLPFFLISQEWCLCLNSP